MTSRAPLLNTSTSKRLRQLLIAPPQSLLVTGTYGVGLLSVAEYIASQSGSTLAIVQPKKRQKSGEYAVDLESGTIIIDDIRDLYVRTRDKFINKQYILIDCAERTISRQAQNAFLKLLEEPQPNIHFIIITPFVNELLPTIRSRCQTFVVEPISQVQSQDLLATLHITDTTKAARILFIASGLPDEIHRLATDTAYYESRVAIVQDARVLLEGLPDAKAKIIYLYKDNRIRTLKLLDDVIKQLTLVAKKTRSPGVVPQIDLLVSAYDRITLNGNITLQLTRVFL